MFSIKNIEKEERKKMNEFIKNRDILDEFMRKNKLKYDEPFKVKICGCIDAIYKISFNGECFYKIKTLDDEWNKVESNPWDLSKIMFDKKMEIMEEC